MTILEMNPLTDPRWMEFIDRSPQATVFHHPAWLRVLYRQYRFRVFALCVEDDNGEIRAGVPLCEVKGLTGKREWIALPFTDHCRILHRDDRDVEAILAHLVATCEATDLSSVEIRTRTPGNQGFKEHSDVVLHEIALEGDPKTVFSRFRGSHVRGIKKAEKNDLKADISDSWEAMEAFYRLHLMTRRKLGVPIQPKGYFRHLHEQVIDKGIGFVLRITRKNRAVAGAVFLTYSDTLVYKYGASDPCCLHLRPNNLLFWTAIREGCLRGETCLDLGKSDLDQPGLRRFKTGWGAEETPLYYSFYPEIPTGRLFHAIKEKIVAPIIRNSPSILCRVTGEMLYKHFP